MALTIYYNLIVPLLALGQLFLIVVARFLLRLKSSFAEITNNTIGNYIKPSY